MARIALLLVGGAAGTAGRTLPAQSPTRLDLGGSIVVGGEAERYLRVLQVAGLTPLTMWSVQPFSPTQEKLLRPSAAHPWQSRFGAEPRGAADTRLLRPGFRLIGNSAFPFQDGAGPTWSGRGLTAEAQMGFLVDRGAMHLQIAPLVFVAQNASFTLAANGENGSGRFADPRFPTMIDAPQRFGDRVYARVDAGNSTASLDRFGWNAGVSTASQRWGPAREYPLVLGPGAGGFPHVFFGTSTPADLWLVRLQARVLYGELSQSAYSPEQTGITRRLGSGLVAAMQPRWFSGVEVGIARFIHRPWEGIPGKNALLRPFSGIVTRNTLGNRFNDNTENQTGSVFARWVLPAVKTEFYGEFYKEDYPGVLHHTASSLVEKPDDLSAFMVGFQRVMSSSAQAMRVLRGELVNGETSHAERGQRGFSAPQPPYIHNSELQGHTVNGRILGSPEAYGGAGWRLGIDDFRADGRRSLTLERSLRLDWLANAPRGQQPVHPDVIYAVRAEALRFRGWGDYGITLIPAIDLNRNLVAHHDVFNFTAAVTLRGWP